MFPQPHRRRCRAPWHQLNSSCSGWAGCCVDACRLALRRMTTAALRLLAMLCDAPPCAVCLRTHTRAHLLLLLQWLLTLVAVSRCGVVRFGGFAAPGCTTRHSYSVGSTKINPQITSTVPHTAAALSTHCTHLITIWPPHPINLKPDHKAAASPIAAMRHSIHQHSRTSSQCSHNAFSSGPWKPISSRSGCPNNNSSRSTVKVGGRQFHSNSREAGVCLVTVDQQAYHTSNVAGR